VRHIPDCLINIGRPDDKPFLYNGSKLIDYLPGTLNFLFVSYEGNVGAANTCLYIEVFSQVADIFFPGAEQVASEVSVVKRKP
jgi:hypothetical protein